MIVPNNQKEQVIKKVRVLIKRFLVDRYLRYGDSADDESMDLLKQLAKRMIFIEQQIRLNKDIPSQHLRWVDGEYRKLYNEKMEKEL